MNGPLIIIEVPADRRLTEMEEDVIRDWFYEGGPGVVILPSGVKAYQLVDGRWRGLDGVIRDDLPTGEKSDATQTA